MKKLLLFFLCSLPLFAQDKTKIIYTKETVFIKADKGLSIETVTQEKRHIPKSKEFEDYTVRIPYNNFNEISDVKGYTLLLKNQKKINLSAAYVSTNEIKREDIFHSDFKFKHFVFPQVEDNSIVEYSYRNKFKEPRLVSQFNFQDRVLTEKAILRIVCDPAVEIGYKLLGENQDKISFTQTTEEGRNVYTWEAKDLEAFKAEDRMISRMHYLPHVIYFVKNYKTETGTNELMGTVDNLYKWYVSLTKNINTKDQTELKSKTLELIKDKSSELEKAKVIFQWVQKNLHYVAFEYGMGGFIPRDAVDVFSKKYGDCKDMANLINEMMHHAGLQSNLTWIGTREKPYAYADVPSPIVDNHMIASALINGRRYYFDATDRYCEFGYPSQMIQGKEALVGISETEYRIEKVPAVSPSENKSSISFNLTLGESDLSGSVTSEISGINKSDLLNQLSMYNSQETEIWKSVITRSNPKIDLSITTSHRNEYADLAARAEYALSLKDWVKNLNGKMLFKPMAIYPFSDAGVDDEKRKFGIDLRSTDDFQITYHYSIPKEYKVEFLPENFTFENELGKMAFTYKFEPGIVKVTQSVVLKKIDFGRNEFQSWNDFIKKLNKNYNQSIVFSK